MSSSPQHFLGSSPARTSQFTYKSLHQLATYSTTCPLRVIAHVDLDAFYAQCEMRHLDTPDDQPLAVQQWQGLIAVNYPARKFGISRMINVDEAKKLCPELIAQHVPTWREGDAKWAYHEDSAANIATHKVSLDPYRLESKKILALIKESLPPDLQRVEKAGIDEVFLDLSAHVHAVLLQRFPELSGPPPYDDPTETLPLPSINILDWQADALVDLDEDAELEGFVDWDDVAILIGSEIVRGVRAEIWRKLHYTCSGGIARNKMLSKLGSGHKKPNLQTCVRNRAVLQFLSEVKFTKIRNLGGKLGDQVVSIFDTESTKELLHVPMDQLKGKLGDETGTWLFNTIRGIDHSEVNSRTQIKSMLSAKSFRPSINTPEQATKWLRIFVADIFSRLVEEGVLENKRRPRTINLHHRHAGQTRSRQSPIHPGKQLDEELLFEMSKTLLSQIIAEGRVWPCANLSLSVGGFEDGITGNMGIDAFLLKGEEAVQSAKTGARAETPVDAVQDHASRKRRAEDSSIQRFFAKQQVGDEDLPVDNPYHGNGGVTTGSPARESTPHSATTPRGIPAEGTESDGTPTPALHQVPITAYLCARCNAAFESSEELQSHGDWHMAKDLQDEERGTSAMASRPAGSRTAGPNRSAASSSKRTARGGKLEHGQSKLKFG